MEGINLCETANCGKPAEAFGMRETAKSRSCREHMPFLLEKGMQIYDIEGYYFITSHNDVAAFEGRKTLVTKGRGNLTVLKASCETEATEALQSIEKAKGNALRSVEDRFEEMKAAVIGTCDELRKQFARLREDFEQYLISKDNQLPPVAQLLCANISTVPRFLRFGIADVSDQISAALSDSWVTASADIHSTLKCLDETQMKITADSALAEAVDYAKKGIQEALLYPNLLIDENELEQTKGQVFTELLKVEKLQIEENLKWLQRSWDLRQRCVFPDSTTLRVGHKLANLIIHQLNQYSIAEYILQFCYSIAQAQNPLSEESMILCVDICGIYYNTAQYEELEHFGEWILQTFAAAGHSAEYYWIILFYLSYSMRSREKNREIDVILNRWRKFRVENKLGEILQLLICADELSCNGNDIEAEKLLIQAKHIGTRHFPTSIFTAVTLFRLGSVGNENSREQLYRQARSIYEVTAPKSIDAANNLNNMGRLFANTLRWSEAEECYNQARSIYEVTAPKSINAAINLGSIGVLLAKSQQWGEALECYRLTRAIYEVTDSKSIDAAVNLDCMGRLFYSIQRWNEAEECHIQAQSIYEITAPKSVDAANNLAFLGDLFEAMKRYTKANECYRKAAEIFAENDKNAENQRSNESLLSQS